MAQYPIPQFIEAEGKIISFLTFRQFFWIVGGGAVCLGLYYTLPYFLFVVLATLVGLFVAFVAFIKINDMSPITLLFNYLSFSTKSKNYVWKKRELTYPFTAKNRPTAPAKGPEASKIHGVKNMIEYRKK